MRSAAASNAWGSLDSAKRIEVLRLARNGDRHPDPLVADAATEWAHQPAWNSLANRLPGWLLPTTAALMAIACGLLGTQITGLFIPAVLALGVVAIGLVGWNATTAARVVRAVYPRPSCKAPDGT